jgi:hypothetical protein
LLLVDKTIQTKSTFKKNILSIINQTNRWRKDTLRSKLRGISVIKLDYFKYMPIDSASMCGMFPTNAHKAARYSASAVRCMKAVNGC